MLKRSEIIHKMEENGVHIGLLPIRKENQADSTATLERIRKNGWDCCEVIEDPEYLFLGSGHPLALTGEITPQMLAQVPLGTYSHVNDDNWLLFGHYFSGEAGFRCHSKDAILQYVAQNRCAAIFPRFTSQYEYFVSQGAVQPVMVHGLDFGHATFLLVHQSGKSLLREEQSVVCALKRYFKDCTCK
ncbi:LysR substrate-binding domain-containing protein [Flavonifractor plautii]|nr:LysR substrate-binding domain-containing protein [Flavonifractor plautii]